MAADLDLSGPRDRDALGTGARGARRTRAPDRRLARGDARRPRGPPFDHRTRGTPLTQPGHRFPPPHRPSSGGARHLPARRAIGHVRADTAGRRAGDPTPEALPAVKPRTRSIPRPATLRPDREGGAANCTRPNPHTPIQAENPHPECTQKARRGSQRHPAAPRRWVRTISRVSHRLSARSLYFSHPRASPRSGWRHLDHADRRRRASASLRPRSPAPQRPARLLPTQSRSHRCRSRRPPARSGSRQAPRTCRRRGRRLVDAVRARSRVACCSPRRFVTARS